MGVLLTPLAGIAPHTAASPHIEIPAVARVSKLYTTNAGAAWPRSPSEKARGLTAGSASGPPIAAPVAVYNNFGSRPAANGYRALPPWLA